MNVVKTRKTNDGLLNTLICTAKPCVFALGLLACFTRMGARRCFLSRGDITRMLFFQGPASHSGSVMRMEAGVGDTAFFSGSLSCLKDAERLLEKSRWAW